MTSDESLRRTIFDLNDKVLARMVQVIVSMVAAFVGLAVGTNLPGVPQPMRQAGLVVAVAALMFMLYCLYRGWRDLRQLKALSRELMVQPYPPPDAQADWRLPLARADWKADDITTARLHRLVIEIDEIHARFRAITVRFLILRQLAWWALWSAAAVLLLHVAALLTSPGSSGWQVAMWAATCVSGGCLAVVSRLLAGVGTATPAAPASAGDDDASNG